MLLEIYLIGLLLSTVYASKTLYDNTVNYNTRYTKKSIFWVSVGVLFYPMIGSFVLSLYAVMGLLKVFDKVNDRKV